MMRIIWGWRKVFALLQSAATLVGYLKDHPEIGQDARKFLDDISVFLPKGK